MHEISTIIILIYRKLGSVGPVQQKIKLPSPNTDKFNYNKQRNFSVSLIRKEKAKCFANLNIKDVTYHKKFGKLLNPVFQISLKILKE